MNRFRTRTYGKWILAGEHAVLRGCPAIAFPLTTRSLELSFEPADQPLNVEFMGPHGMELNLLFYGVLENALKRLQITEPLKGSFQVFNMLPIGAGLGASAALCGAVGRWCEAQGWIVPEQVYEFSRRLEDLFHGESSGVDIAVSLSGQGVRFVRGGERAALKPVWWPRFYLSYCGQRGMTSDCVSQVKALFETDRKLAVQVDAQMETAVEMAQSALLNSGPEAWGQLKAALDLAAECFQSWGLCSGPLNTHMRELEKAGAHAVKPTGSGGGGFVLSLWQEEPPEWKDKLLEVTEPK